MQSRIGPHPFVALATGVLTASGLLYVARHSAAAPDRPPEAPAAVQAAPVDSPLRDRAAFAHLLAQVKVGMPREKVRELLGKPDDVWAGEEVNACRVGFVFREGKEAWAYGGEGHLTFPTLGKVSFDGSGKVVVVQGHGERLPGASLPPEPETRRVLRLMDRLKGCDDSSDPLRVIQVVNALEPLGKAGALAVIDEFDRVADVIELPPRRDGLVVVVRCLFDVPDPPGYLPQSFFGGVPFPGAPKDPRRSPRFPVVLYRDIPLVGSGGGWHAGGHPTLEWHLEPYRERGTVRAQPLRPPDNPLAAVDRLLVSSEWPAGVEDQARARSMAREQVLRLVDPVYRVEEDQFDFRLTGGYDRQEPQWRTHLQGFAGVGAHWDPARSTYVRRDGTFLPPRSEPSYYPRIWLAQTPTGGVKVVLGRIHRKAVDVSLTPRGAKPPPTLLRVFVGDIEVKTVRGFGMTGFRAPDGSDIRLVLEQNGKAVASTVVRP